MATFVTEDGKSFMLSEGCSCGQGFVHDRYYSKAEIEEIGIRERQKLKEELRAEILSEAAG